ncbi:MAG: tripartite tricarboxylate transporter substrate binding protein [Sphaerochaetaceae bacterium]
MSISKRTKRVGSFANYALIAIFILVTSMVFGAGQEEAQGMQEDAAAIEFPTRPVQYVVGWSAGGGSDIVSRVLCAEAEKFLGQPITVVNHSGGSGARSYTEIANAPADGYVIGNTTGTISTHVFMGNLDFGHEAFVPVMTINSDPGAIWVKTDAPWETLQDLIDDLKANPESITIASSNPGSITRFGTLLLEKAAGVKFKIASQAGGESAGPGLVAGGHVDACQAAPVTAKSLYEAGEIRPLGVMDTERVAAFPEIPTYKEQGYDITIYNMRQIIAPKDTPDEVVDILYQAFKKAANSDKYQNFMKDSGSTPLDWDPEKSREFLIEQDKQFKQYITDAGLLVE